MSTVQQDVDDATDNDYKWIYEYEYKDDSSRLLDKITINDEIEIYPKLDVYGRNKGKEICVGTNKIAEEQIVYRKVGDHATNMPSTIRYGHVVNNQFVLRDSIKYAYDNMGNITEIYENGKLFVSYEYDKLNRLVRENNRKMNFTKLFAYDNNGNIILQEEYDYTVKPAEELGLAKVIKEYCYQPASDQLLKIVTNTLDASEAYEETTESFTYAAIGNPTAYRGKTATWEKGRRLTKYGTHTFTYDTRGRRLRKNTIQFTYDSSGRLIKQSNGLTFFYDHTGVAGLKYNNHFYCYRKDVQGNIIAILDSYGEVVVEYSYDAWGRNACSGYQCETLGALNPFRYRGYYYDTETGLYYLKTRYYDPTLGRFMTIDGIEYLDPETINGLNLYAYCNNNPVMNVDPNGTWSWKKFWRGVVVVVGAAAAVVVTVCTLGAGSVAGAMIIGATVAAAGNLFNQTVIQGKSFGQVDYNQVAFSAIVGGVSSGFGLLGATIVSFGAGVVESLASGDDWKTALTNGLGMAATAFVAGMITRGFGMVKIQGLSKSSVLNQKAFLNSLGNAALFDYSLVTNNNQGLINYIVSKSGWGGLSNAAKEAAGWLSNIVDAFFSIF